MSGEWAGGELSGMMDSLRDQLRDISDFELRRTALTATATALDGAVSVTVNADGQVVDTHFADDLDGISSETLGAAVTSAAQAAAAEVARQATELRAPLLRQHENLPSMSDLMAGLPDLSAARDRMSRPLAQPEHADTDIVAPTRPVSEVLATPDEEPLWQPPSDAEEPDDIRRTSSDSEVSESGWG